MMEIQASQVRVGDCLLIPGAELHEDLAGLAVEFSVTGIEDLLNAKHETRFKGRGRDGSVIFGLTERVILQGRRFM